MRVIDNDTIDVLLYCNPKQCDGCPVAPACDTLTHVFTDDTQNRDIGIALLYAYSIGKRDGRGEVD